MYPPKIDKIFGSDLIHHNVDDSLRKVRASSFYVQSYKIMMTQWEALDSPTKRCNNDASELNTTMCLTQYLEHEIGCSMGLAGSDPEITRWYKLL